MGDVPGQSVIISDGGSTITDRSGAIVTGGASQEVAVAVGSPRRVFVQNPSAESESLFVNYGAPATISVPAAETNSGANSIEVMPGGSDERMTAQAVNVVAVTEGHVFVAKEWTA